MEQAPESVTACDSVLWPSAQSKIKNPDLESLRKETFLAANISTSHSTYGIHQHLREPCLVQWALGGLQGAQASPADCEIPWRFHAPPSHAGPPEMSEGPALGNADAGDFELVSFPLCGSVSTAVQQAEEAALLHLTSRWCPWKCFRNHKA